MLQSNPFVYHCVIIQTLQIGQTLGQFFEPLYINCENDKQCHVTSLISFQHDFITSTTFSFHPHLMKPTSSAKHSTVISLLQEGYSLCQIESKTGLGKSIVGRISKEVDCDKENSKGGCPPKLSPGNKRSIIKKALKKHPKPPKGVHELWDRVVEEWNKIPPETCQNLIESMPRRMQAVIKAKGGHIKY